MYVLRADVELLQKCPHEWSKEKLGFFWYTKFGDSKMFGNPWMCVNDTLFYCPSSLMVDFRTALSHAHLKAYTDENLHWLSHHGRLKEHVQVCFAFNHPANTQKETNPFYKMTCRQEGRCNPGKFAQFALSQPSYNSLKKRQITGMTPDQKRQSFKQKVHELLDAHGEFALKEFATLFSRRFPDEAIEWYLGKYHRIGKKLMEIADVRVRDHTVSRRNKLWQPISRWRKRQKPSS